MLLLMMELHDGRGHEFVGAVKGYSKFFPKKDLEEAMKNYPSGASLVMECNVPKEDGLKLLAIAWLQIQSKEDTFVCCN